MAERKTKPVVKKATVSRAAGAAAGKSRTLKAASVMAATPRKAATAAAKPETTRTPAAKRTASAAGKPGSAITPAAKKAIVPVAAKKAPAQKAVATSARPATRKIVAQPTPEERYRMVQTAAYFIAEHNGFGGSPADHWAAAEREIAKRLGL